MYCKRAFNQYGSSVTDMITITVSQLGELEQFDTPPGTIYRSLQRWSSQSIT